MSNPTIGALLFGFLAIIVHDNQASIALAILCIGCWLNKSLEELKETKSIEVK